MKQSEKLDSVLKLLYKERNSGKYITNEYIAEEGNLDLENLKELSILLKRLHEDGLIQAHFYLGGGGMARITSHGIEYCEENSYSYKGKAITSNHYTTTINNSSGISIVNDSNNINVNISNIGDINNKIEDLVKLIQSSPEVPAEIKTEMIDCIDEMKSSLSNDKKPKHSFNALLGMANNFAGISTLAIEIGKLIFE